MHRRRTRIWIIALALVAQVAVHEWCDVSPKRWVVKGKLGSFGYEQWDYESAHSDRSGFLHNTTSIYIGPLKLAAPMSMASLLLAQVTVPLIVWCVAGRSRRKAIGESSSEKLIPASQDVPLKS